MRIISFALENFVTDGLCLPLLKSKLANLNISKEI